MILAIDLFLIRCERQIIELFLKNNTLLETSG